MTGLSFCVSERQSVAWELNGDLFFQGEPISERRAGGHRSGDGAQDLDCRLPAENCAGCTWCIRAVSSRHSPLRDGSSDCSAA